MGAAWPLLSSSCLSQQDHRIIKTGKDLHNAQTHPLKDQEPQNPCCWQEEQDSWGPTQAEQGVSRRALLQPASAFPQVCIHRKPGHLRDPPGDVQVRGAEGVPAADGRSLPRDAGGHGPEGPGDRLPALHAGQALREDRPAGEEPGAEVW